MQPLVPVGPWSGQIYDPHGRVSLARKAGGEAKAPLAGEFFWKKARLKTRDLYCRVAPSPVSGCHHSQCRRRVATLLYPHITGMAKDGATTRMKKTNSLRKKTRNGRESSTLSARISAIIAEKKRRKSGQRRICQGMCFSLPSPNDPFNDTHGRKGLKKQEYVSKEGSIHKKMKHSQEKGSVNNTAPSEDSDGKNKNDHIGKSGMSKNNRCPSTFLIMCLNTIQQELEITGKYSNLEGKPLFCNAWGVDFWMNYSAGKDMFDKHGSYSMIEKISWIASTTADDISEMEKTNSSFTIPFLLFLVPNVEKAIEVRAVCKPLKEFGIHTVSLHQKASIDHQIHGLKCLDPEFIVSTPSRLLELLDVNAIDISGISVMVIIGGGGSVEEGGVFSEMTKTIRQSICGKPITIRINDDSSTPIAS